MASGALTAVETQFFDLPENFMLFSGESLGSSRLAYETFGELNVDKSNAVLVFHALSGSQHLAGWNDSVDGVENLWVDECKIGWWDDFVGPGKSIDTNSKFVICANYLGGCYGSTGPASIDPETGLAFGSSFPDVHFSDIVESQKLLVDYLGIAKLDSVLGSSLGGLLAVLFAAKFPDSVERVVSVASGIALTPLQEIHNFEQATAIVNDPYFFGGDYYLKRSPDDGLALARVIAHKTYVSLEAMSQRASGRVVQSGGNRSYVLNSALESYMAHQGSKFVQRFDANTYLLILSAWQRFDLVFEAGACSFAEIFSRLKDVEFLIFSIDSDVCFYPEEQARLVDVLESSGVNQVRHVTVHSDKGHDSFLLEPELFSPYFVPS